MKTLLSALFVLVSLTSVSQERNCATSEYAQRTISNFPELKKRILAAEASASEFVASTTDNGAVVEAVSDVIRIPVVIHVLYNNGTQNISEAQILSQIEALNKDFRKLNKEVAGIPAAFKAIAADVKIEFALAKFDPKGLPTTGITRTATANKNWRDDDKMKSSKTGGVTAWDTKSYLNVWVVNLDFNMLGYASVVGGPAENDGIVMQYTAFGTNGTAAAPFNLGRTMTHEVGHWLNLKHIWGDFYCGDDKVDDTPKQGRPTTGCPSGTKFTCGTNATGDMYMNFMDFTDDVCMAIFTEGQKSRMRALFANGGLRNSILNSKAFVGGQTPIVTVEAPKENNQPVVVTAPAVSNVKSLSIFPNPARSFVTLQHADETIMGKNVRIFNAAGNMVNSFIMNSMQMSVNINNLPSGIYYIKMGEGKDQITEKFIKL